MHRHLPLVENRSNRHNVLSVRESTFLPEPATTWREKEFAKNFFASSGRGGSHHRRCSSSRTSANSPIRCRALASVLESIAASAVPTLRKPELSSMFGQVRRQPSRWRSTGFDSDVIHGFYQPVSFIVINLLLDRINHVGILSERGLRDRFTFGSLATRIELEFRGVRIHG
jgi:hypothetical protein